MAATALLAGVTFLAVAPAAQADTGPGVVATIATGANPEGVAVDPSTHNVYVANASDGTVSMIDESGDATTGTVTATIDIGNVAPFAVAVDPGTHNIYTANTSGNTVSVIDESGDATTGTVTATIAVGPNPRAVAVDPATHNVYVANSGDDTVSVIDESGDATTGTVTATIAVGDYPQGVAVDPATHNVYVVNSGGNTVSVIDESGDATTGTVTAIIAVGAFPFGLAVDPSTHNVYTANFEDNTVSVIDESGDATTGTVTATIAVANRPIAVAVDPSTHNVYTADYGYKTVSVIDESGDATTGTVTASVAVGREPFGLAVDPSTHNVYATNFEDNTLSVIAPSVTGPMGVAPAISGTPPAATSGTPYSFQFTVTGSPAPVESTTGTVPPGLSVSSTGALAGTPTVTGTYSFTVTASNGVAPDATDPVTMTVNPATVPPVNLFTPVSPARDLDTRNGTGGTTGPVAGNHTFNLTVTGVHGVPTTGVGAVALNVTVTNPTCAAFLTVFPAGQPVPVSSNLNYTAGQTIPNLVVVGVGTAGQVSFNVPAACAGTIQVIADIQGWYSAQTATPPPGSYTPVTPARDLDTRSGAGGTTGPVAGNHTFNLTVTGVHGVPASGVGAVALNVTVTNPTCAAFLSVFPAGQPVPSSSNLNYSAGQTIPNLVFVGVGTGGQVSFNVPAACAGTIQVIADIQGWYSAQSATPLSGSYTPLTPARDLDTRNGTGGTTGPVAGNHTFNLTVTGVNGVPATGVEAVALNVTATSTTCAAWLTVFATGQPVPASSNLNYTAGQTIPNLVIVGVGSGGQVSFNVPAACAGTIQVIADIQGWYSS